MFGLSLSVASTVVLIKALESRGILDTANGRIAVGWLVVEDLVMVLVLVLLPSLSGWLGGQQGHGLATGGDRAPLTTLLLTLGNVAAFVALMLVVGRRVFHSCYGGWRAPDRANYSRWASLPRRSASPSGPPRCSASPLLWEPSLRAW